MTTTTRQYSDLLHALSCLEVFERALARIEIPVEETEAFEESKKRLSELRVGLADLLSAAADH